MHVAADPLFEVRCSGPSSMNDLCTTSNCLAVPGAFCSDKLNNTFGYLVAHVNESPQGQPEGEAFVVADKVADILQQEVARAVEVCKREVGHDLQCGVTQSAEVDKQNAGACTSIR